MKVTRRTEATRWVGDAPGRDEGVNLAFVTPLKGVAAPALAGCIGGRMQCDFHHGLLTASAAAVVSTATKRKLGN